LDGVVDHQITYLIFNLIENIKHNLNYLSISAYNTYGGFYATDGYVGCCSTILQHLGQILPSKLEYLDLNFHTAESVFEVFLKNSQDTFID
jgi:hypothetical protein